MIKIERSLINTDYYYCYYNFAGRYKMIDPSLKDRLTKIYNNSIPILLVLFFVALIVFFNSYPNVPAIADDTKFYRQQVLNKLDSNDTIADEIKIVQPEAPSLPNTISPVISPEEVEDIVSPQPKPEPQPKPTPGNESSEPAPETTPARKEPPMEIKLLTGFLNVAPLILIATIGGFGIYLLFKYKKHLTLRSMFGTAIGLVAICTLVFFGAITINFAEFLYCLEFDADIFVWIIIAVAIPTGILISYNVISKKTTIFRRNMGLAVSGALMGAFLAAFLPVWIIFVLLVGIALFDMYSVKYGPIKKILDLDEQNNNERAQKQNKLEKKVEKVVVYRTIEGGKQNANANFKNHKHSKAKQMEGNAQSRKQSTGDKPALNNPNISPVDKRNGNKSGNKDENKNDDEEFDLMLMYDNPNWSLGLGDFVIYSMFTSAVLTYCLLYLPYYIFYSPILGLLLPWIIFIFSALGLLTGFFITLRLLQKREYLPGLPITIGCGLVVFIICIVILQLVNYLWYSQFAIIF